MQLRWTIAYEDENLGSFNSSTEAICYRFFLQGLKRFDLWSQPRATNRWEKFKTIWRRYLGRFLRTPWRPQLSFHYSWPNQMAILYETSLTHRGNFKLLVMRFVEVSIRILWLFSSIYFENSWRLTRDRHAHCHITMLIPSPRHDVDLETKFACFLCPVVKAQDSKRIYFLS